MSEEVKIKFIMKTLQVERDELELMTFGFNPDKLDQLLETAQKIVSREIAELQYELA